MAPLAPESSIFDVADLTEIAHDQLRQQFREHGGHRDRLSAVKSDSNCHATYAFAARVRPDRRLGAVADGAHFVRDSISEMPAMSAAVPAASIDQPELNRRFDRESVPERMPWALVSLPLGSGATG